MMRIKHLSRSSGKRRVLVRTNTRLLGHNCRGFVVGFVNSKSSHPCLRNVIRGSNLKRGMAFRNVGSRSCVFRRMYSCSMFIRPDVHRKFKGAMTRTVTTGITIIMSSNRNPRRIVSCNGCNCIFGGNGPVSYTSGLRMFLGRRGSRRRMRTTCGQILSLCSVGIAMGACLSGCGEEWTVRCVAFRRTVRANVPSPILIAPRRDRTGNGSLSLRLLGFITVVLVVGIRDCVVCPPGCRVFTANNAVNSTLFVFYSKCALFLNEVSQFSG